MVNPELIFGVANFFVGLAASGASAGIFHSVTSPSCRRNMFVSSARHERQVVGLILRVPVPTEVQVSGPERVVEKVVVDKRAGRDLQRPRDRKGGGEGEAHRGRENRQRPSQEVKVINAFHHAHRDHE